ncbi:MAG: hypothetical protein KatS3mg076_1402 [Candidatus Binatia bacterium]|nr:MAG: hypothetical protein KatS3mg076_1402 [Candidatus Binatia bacterium]
MLEVRQPDTRERILQVAERHFADLGYHGARLARIAEEAGLQKASLFHYFRGKAELYDAVLAKGFREIEGPLEAVLENTPAGPSRVFRLLDTYVDTVVRHPERTKLWLRQALGDLPPLSRPFEVESLIRRVADSVRSDSHLPPKVDSFALVLAVLGMVAFFFTSVPVLVPGWANQSGSLPFSERVKRHVFEIVSSCLEPPRATEAMREIP